MSKRLKWQRTPAKGWGLWRGVSRHTKISDPAKKTDYSPKTRKWLPGKKEKLIEELEERGFP